MLSGKEGMLFAESSHQRFFWRKKFSENLAFFSFFSEAKMECDQKD